MLLRRRDLLLAGFMVAGLWLVAWDLHTTSPENYLVLTTTRTDNRQVVVALPIAQVQETEATNRNASVVVVVSLNATIIPRPADDPLPLAPENATTASTSSYTTTKTSRNEDSGLWIFVSEFQEGISAWVGSLAQLMYLAKTYNATLVLPEVTRGRLNTGYHPHHPSVLSLFDEEWVRAQHSKWATFQEYQDMLDQHINHTDTAVKVYHVCLPMPWRKVKQCPDVAPKVSSHQRRIPPVEQALAAAIQNGTLSQLDRPIVLHIHQLYHGGLSKAHIHTSMIAKNTTKHSWIPLLDKKQVASLRDGLLSHFHSRFYQQADDFLEREGLSGQPITTIHWRAELPQIDYLQCARDLQRIRQKMTANAQGEQARRFVLMTSIQTNTSMAWSGTSQMMENSTALQAIDLLTTSSSSNNAFVKMELPQAPDMIDTVIVELILATSERSATFITCAKDRCRSNSLCGKCNHLGKFALMAMEMRARNASLTTLPCWPEPSKVLASA